MISREGCRLIVLRVSIVVMAVLATACSSDSPSGPTPASGSATSAASVTPSDPPSSVSPAEAAGQAAITAYLGMWEDYAVAAETSNWQDPLLAQHATGTALTNITRGLYTAKQKGLVSKGRPKNNPEVSSAEPQSAPIKVIIADCGDSTDWIQYRADTGEPADDSPGGRREINAVVEKQADDAWRVTDFGVHGIGTC